MDNTILHDANSITPQYANLASLAARQTIGSTEITVANSSDGQWNTSDVKIFMKNIGSDRWVVFEVYMTDLFSRNEVGGRTPSRFFTLLSHSFYTSTQHGVVNFSLPCLNSKILANGRSRMLLVILVGTKRRYNVWLCH